MSKITLNNVGNIIDATTAATTINANNAVIQTAMDNTLSRNGTAPNMMGSNLDMNNFQILNQGAISFTVATLPTGVLGKQAVVTDGTASLAWGATVTGGGSTKYFVWYNGVAWTVMGK